MIFLLIKVKGQDRYLCTDIDYYNDQPDITYWFIAYDDVVNGTGAYDRLVICSSKEHVDHIMSKEGVQHVMIRDSITEIEIVELVSINKVIEQELL